MNRGVVVWTGASLAAVVACGVLTAPPTPTAPVNSCTDNASCAKTFADASVLPQCASGVCIGETSLRPILVVSVPEGISSPLAGLSGSSFGLPDTYELNRKSFAPPCTNRLDLYECDFVPPLWMVQNGNLRVSKGFGIALWPPGLRPNQADPPPPASPTPTSLPIHVVFHPLWTDPASGTALLAQKLGMPIDDRVATISRAPQASFIALLGPTASTTAVNGTVFAAQLPQPISFADPTGAYRVEVIPDDPFGVFPPYLTELPVITSQAGTSTGTFDLSTFVPVFNLPPNVVGQPLFETDHEVDEASGAPSLEGWTLHVDDNDGVRLSGLVTLPAGATKVVQVWDATGSGDQTGQTLYVDPPSGVDEPRMVVKAAGNTISYSLPYPALPPPVSVSGFVQRADDLKTTTPALIIFSANGQETNGPYVLEADGTTPAPTLAYVQRHHTTSDGEYQVTLPPGSLRAYILPDAPDLALTVLNGRKIGLELVQNGRALPVNPRAHVRGRVVLPGGSPVYAATVVIDPSPDDAFAQSSDPSSDPLARPREVSGETDTDGRFDVLSDPGLVDISIRPHDGTQLPWVVVTNRIVPINIPGDAGTSPDLVLSDVVVPLPSSFPPASSGILTDTLGDALPHAIVRAYAFPTLAPGDDGGPPATRAAREIGATVTDATGVYQLFIAPPD